MCVDANDNELAWLESIHLFVEVLGKSLVLSLSLSPNLPCLGEPYLHSTKERSS